MLSEAWIISNLASFLHHSETYIKSGSTRSGTINLSLTDPKNIPRLLLASHQPRSIKHDYDVSMKILCNAFFSRDFVILCEPCSILILFGEPADSLSR